jgi:DNA-binding MarR family transcriptional regulator
MPKTRPDNPNSAVGLLGHQVRELHHAFRSELERRLAPHGIPSGMGYYLRALWEEDGLTQRDLSARAGTSEPTTVEMLRKMEAKRLIVRRRSAKDRRKLHVYLTRKGKALEAKALPYMTAIQDQACEAVSDAEMVMFRSVLARMLDNLARRRDGARSRTREAA